MVKSILILTIGGALAGCSVNSESSTKQTSEEKVQKETAQEPDIKSTGQSLIFKTDTEELVEKAVPDYVLKKIVKQYEGNKEVGGRISSNEGVTSISYGEIGENTASMGEEQAVAMAKEWISI